MNDDYWNRIWVATPPHGRGDVVLVNVPTSLAAIKGYRTLGWTVRGPYVPEDRNA